MLNCWKVHVLLYSKVLQKALECRRINVHFKIFRGSMPPDPPSMACLRHAVVAYDAYVG